MSFTEIPKENKNPEGQLNEIESKIDGDESIGEFRVCEGFAQLANNLDEKDLQEMCHIQIGSAIADGFDDESRENYLNLEQEYREPKVA